MKIKKRLAPIAMATLGVVGVGALTAGAAFASPGSGTVKAVTHASHHPDTCACTTNTFSSNGYVWAYDNLSRQFTVSPETGLAATSTSTPCIRAWPTPSVRNAGMPAESTVATGNCRSWYSLSNTATLARSR